MDVAAQMVDKEIEEFERKLKREYEKAQKDIEKECKKYLQKYQKKDKLMREKVKLKEISQEDYITWRWNQLAQGKRYQNLVKSIENQLVQTNVVAADMVNDATPRVYAENINYAMYDVEKGIKAQTSFSLYNTTTVRNSIMKGDMYIPKASVDIPKDRLWNRKKVQSVFTQSIIKGESIPEISKSLRQVTDANRAQATRTARTCMTAVQNDARIDGYMRARELGIDVKKGWLATLDNRTRQSHRHIDGEIVELEEEFSNGCQYPGDPRGKPEEIYNCRCTLVPKIGNAKMLPMSMRANNLPGGISYEDWKRIKEKSQIYSFDGLIKPKRPKRSDFGTRDEYDIAYESYKSERDNYERRVDKQIQKALSKNTFSNWDEANEWAKEIGISITDDVVNEIDIRSMNDVKEVLNDLFKRFPEIKGYDVETYDGSSFHMSFTLGITREFDHLMDANAGINFNDRSFSNYEDALRTEVYQMNSGFNVMGDGTFGTTIRHEFGHNVDTFLKYRIDNKYHANVDNWRENFKSFEDFKNAQSEWKKERAQYTKELMSIAELDGRSEYSLTNELELFAEGFASYTSGEQTAFAKAFGQFLKRWY